MAVRVLPVGRGSTENDDLQAEQEAQWRPTWTKEELVTSQRCDEDLHKIYKSLTDDELPTWRDFSFESEG